MISSISRKRNISYQSSYVARQPLRFYLHHRVDAFSNAGVQRDLFRRTNPQESCWLFPLPSLVPR